MFIYKITNTSNHKVYVGQTIEVQVEKRWVKHQYLLRKNKHYNQHLQSAWNKYGESFFSFEVIEQFDSEMNFDLDNLERYWIKRFDSMNPSKGYNKTEGGNNCKKTDEIKRKLSESLKGRIFSKEHQLKLSESRKGKRNPRFGKFPPNRKKVVCTNTGTIYESSLAAAMDLKCHPQNIAQVLKGHRKHTLGFHFQYYVEKS